MAWYENTDGQGTFGPQRIVTTNVDSPCDIFATDLDGDGDMDVLSASQHSIGGDRIDWYENTDGQGTFGPQQVITTDANSYVFAADVDGDADADVLTGLYSGTAQTWFENTDESNGFAVSHRIGLTDSRGRVDVAADIDGDGDLDLVALSEHIAWYENTDGQGTFGPENVLNLPRFYPDSPAEGTSATVVADFNGDGAPDALVASRRKIAWHENSDGKGSFRTPQLVTRTLLDTNSIVAADLDGDGDVDVLAGSGAENKVVWFENNDGLGTFGPERLVTTSVMFVTSVHAADMDGDGDLDVLSASSEDDKLAWYENLDGVGTFGQQRIVTTAADHVRSVAAADVDGDGDLDVLAASQNDNEIAWYENIGRGRWTRRVIETYIESASIVIAMDMEGDDDIDVLADAFLDNAVWYENIDGRENFSARREVTSSGTRDKNISAADVDGDGDTDVLFAAFCRRRWITHDPRTSQILTTTATRTSFRLRMAMRGSPGMKTWMEGGRSDLNGLFPLIGRAYTLSRLPTSMVMVTRMSWLFGVSAAQSPASRISTVSAPLGHGRPLPSRTTVPLW